MLTAQQKERYARNILIPQINEAGQSRLLLSHVLVVGCGGLGSPLLFYLAAAGVGKITIVDSDKVELSNLQRQVIHRTQDIGENKTKSAAQKLRLLNPDIQIIEFSERIADHNIDKLTANHDLVVDATDNFETRFLINSSCIKNKVPMVHAAVKNFAAQIAVFKGYENDNPCYACFNPNEETTEISAYDKGILGSVAGFAGCMEATFAIKEILGLNSDRTYKQITIIDLLNNTSRNVAIHKNPHCNHCKNL